MTGAASPAIWHERTPLLVLGTGAALPGEPIATEELLTAVHRRFALALRRSGLAIAHKLGILKPDCGGGQVLGFDLGRDAEEIRERVG